MTTNDTHTLGVSAIDRVLPDEYEILQPTEQDYFTFAASVIPRQRLLAEEYGTRYIQLSAQYDHDPYFHAGLTHTVAAFTHRGVVIHRLKSDETAVRMEFSAEEMAALVEGYQSYLAECQGGTAAPEFDPFADVPEEHE
jgi:hypothetical protein